MNLQRYYLGLGSNQEHRLWHIQTAILQLNTEDVHVIGCSKVYENVAQGFHGGSFYNCCVAVDTSRDPSELLSLTLEIELDHGRKRSKVVEGYQDRPLDIDLLIGSQSLQTASLTLPHPRMAQRRFVLEPLEELMRLVNDSIHLKRISTWLSDCEDRATLTPVTYELVCTERMLWNTAKTIVIEGCIGVGKTSLCKLLSERYGLTEHLEAFESNPYLNQFYQDPSTYALPTELHFLADRHRALLHLKGKRGVIADYHISKSKLFAALNLSGEDLVLFNRFFEWSEQLTESPELYVLLDAPTPIIQERIIKRSRAIEKGIEETYLERIRKAYHSLHDKEDERLLIDTTEFDFIADPQTLDALCKRITEVLVDKRLRA
jgi:deoxyguanosine kinase